MANGQKFDRYKLTAACWCFPLGTVIRVVNLDNGKSVVVTITDRGPNLRLHRVLDLSEAAAKQLDYIARGLTPVFFSPAVAVETQPAQLDAHLLEPSSPSPKELSRESEAQVAARYASASRATRLDPVVALRFD